MTSGALRRGRARRGEQVNERLRHLDGSSGSSELVQCARDDRQMFFGGSGLK